MVPEVLKLAAVINLKTIDCYKLMQLYFIWI